MLVIHLSTLEPSFASVYINAITVIINSKIFCNTTSFLEIFQRRRQIYPINRYSEAKQRSEEQSRGLFRAIYWILVKAKGAIWVTLNPIYPRLPYISNCCFVLYLQLIKYLRSGCLRVQSELYFSLQIWQ